MLIKISFCKTAPTIYVLHPYNIILKFKKYNISSLLVINKIDGISTVSLQALRKKFTDAFFVSAETGEGIEELKKEIATKLEEEEEEIPIIGDLVPYDGKVVLVIPIDSEAPKGRIILPQITELLIRKEK